MTELPRRTVRPRQRFTAGQQHAADPGGHVQVQRDRHVAEPAAPRFGQAGQPRIVAHQHGHRPGGQLPGHVHPVPGGQPGLHHPAVAQRGRHRRTDAHQPRAQPAPMGGEPLREVVQQVRAGGGLALPPLHHFPAPGELEGGDGEGVVPQVHGQRDGTVRVRGRHPGGASAGPVHSLAGPQLELLDEIAVGQVPDQDGRRPAGQAELAGELGPGPHPATVVNRPQQPGQIVRAQVRARRRPFGVESHLLIVPRLRASYPLPHSLAGGGIRNI